MSAAASFIELQGFEQVEATPGTALLRVVVRLTDGAVPGELPRLLIDDGARVHRLRPLPSPRDGSGVLRAAYSAQTSLLAGRTAFALEFSEGNVIDLPAPTPRRPRSSDRTAQPAPQPAPRHAAARAELLEERRLRADAERRAEARRHAIDELERRLQTAQDRCAEAEGRAVEADDRAVEAEGRAVEAEGRATQTSTAHDETLARLAALEAEQRATQQSEADLRAELAAAIKRAAESDQELTTAREQLATLRTELDELTSRRAVVDELLPDMIAALGTSAGARAGAEVAVNRLEAERGTLLAETERVRSELSERLTHLEQQLEAARATAASEAGARERLAAALEMAHVAEQRALDLAERRRAELLETVRRAAAAQAAEEARADVLSALGAKAT